MADRSFRGEIRQLVDREVPMAPWLEDRVIASIRSDAASPRGWAAFGADRRLLMATVAAAVIAVVLVGALLGAAMVRHSNVQPATKPSPSATAAVANYRAVIDRDYRAVLTAETGSIVCSPRGSCIANHLKLRSTIEALIQDIASTPTPASLSSYAAQLTLAAQQYVQGLDTAINALEDPNIDYTQVSTPAVLSANLELAVATVDCWPARPTPTVSFIGPNGYGCTT